MDVKNISKVIFASFVIGMLGVGQLQLFAQEAIVDDIEMLCSQLEKMERYEGRKIGYEKVESDSWVIGDKILEYGLEAIPYLLDIYQNSENIIAQVFAARLVAEIDYDKGMKLLEFFRNNELIVKTLFEDSVDSMAIGNVARKEISILNEQKEKSETMQDHKRSDL